MRFYNPPAANSCTASRYVPHERFCLLGWHWIPDHEVVYGGIERAMGSRTHLQACQSCLQAWYAKRRFWVGSLSGTAHIGEWAFRPKHLSRIDRWIRNRAPLMRDISNARLDRPEGAKETP